MITLYICSHACAKNLCCGSIHNNRNSFDKSNYIPIIKHPNVKVYDAIIIRQYP